MLCLFKIITSIGYFMKKVCIPKWVVKKTVVGVGYAKSPFDFSEKEDNCFASKVTIL